MTSQISPCPVACYARSMRVVVTCLIMVLGCGQPPERLAPQAEVTGVESRYWNDRPLETVTGVVKSIAYSIDLPARSIKTSAMVNDRWRAKGGGYPTLNVLIDVAPSTNTEVPGSPNALATTQFGARGTFEREVKETSRQHHAGPVIHSVRRAADVWAFSFEYAPNYEGAMHEASVFARVGKLLCHGHLRATKRGENVKPELQKLERMCLSLSAK